LRFNADCTSGFGSAYSDCEHQHPADHCGYKTGLFRRAGRASTSKVYVDISGRRAIISAKKYSTRTRHDSSVGSESALIKGIFKPEPAEEARVFGLTGSNDLERILHGHV